MENNATCKTPEKGHGARNGYNHPKKCVQRFCNGISGVCNGIVSGCHTWAANDSGGCEYGTLECGEDFSNDTVLYAENESRDGWYLIAPFGSFHHKVGVQKFDTAAANEIMGAFKSRWNWLKGKLGFGTVIPVYYGHPDVGPDGRPGISPKHFDQNVYGKVSDLAVSRDGLRAKIEWNPDFERLPHGLRFSPYWMMKTISPRLHRPVFLKSIGPTPTPNIPAAAAANEAETDNSNKNQTEENDMLKELLKLLGYSDEAAQKFVDKSEGAPSEDEIRAKVQELLDGTSNAEAAKTAQADAERKLAEAQTAAANERAAMADYVVNAAIRAGKLTEAERARRTDGLKNAENFVAAANEIEALEPVVETESETEGLKAGDAKANAKAAFNGLVAKYEADGMEHFDATMRAKREMPEQYKLAFES